MTQNEFYYLSADKRTTIHAVEWCPSEEPRAILQVAHGVTEHMLCYAEMAEFFTARGIVLVGNDHLGHGSSVAKDAQPMYFGPEDSWNWVEEDMYTCLKMTKEKYPDIPYFVLGLSLGSFLVRTFSIHHPGKVDGIVLAGTGQSPAMQLRLVKLLAKNEAKKVGEDQTTPMIHKLTFEMYNKQFTPNHTDYDWLCASKAGLDSYIADPLRGEDMSAGLFREMLTGMLCSGNLKNQMKMDKDVPVLLISGENDPVGENGKGVRATYRSFQKAGVKNVSMKLYPGLRHDIFIEDEKQDVFEYIYQWLEDECLKA